MKWSFRIAKIAGTEVRVHATFFLLLFWVGMSFLLSGGTTAAITSIVFICALFLCVLLHEFGHVLTAKRFGIETPDITLLPIGGLARMKSMPKRPSQELVVALAGPAVNLVIALLLFAILGRTPHPFPAEFKLDEPGALLPHLAVLNIWLALFNLIPAFPMDGGRVLRALLASFMDHGRATNIAARIGQALAIVGGFVGFSIGHPILILIAIFIYFGAAQENAASMMREALDGVSIRRAMLTEFATLEPDATIADAANALIAGSQQHFPVVDATQGYRGTVLRNDLIAALAQRDLDYPVSKIMHPTKDALCAEASIIEALEALNESGSPMLPVIDRKRNRLEGVVTVENVAELMMVMSALRRHSGKPHRKGGSLLRDGVEFDSAALLPEEKGDH